MTGLNKNGLKDRQKEKQLSIDFRTYSVCVCGHRLKHLILIKTGGGRHLKPVAGVSLDIVHHIPFQPIHFSCRLTYRYPG